MQDTHCLKSDSCDMRHVRLLLGLNISSDVTKNSFMAILSMVSHKSHIGANSVVDITIRNSVKYVVGFHLFKAHLAISQIADIKKHIFYLTIVT